MKILQNNESTVVKIVMDVVAKINLSVILVPYISIMTNISQLISCINLGVVQAIP